MPKCEKPLSGVWREENHTAVLKRGKKCSKSILKAKADSDGKGAMNILQAGSAEPHSRWHSRVHQKPIGHGRVKFLIVLSGACWRRGPRTCTPPPQSDYAVNWMHKQAVWDEFGGDRQRCRSAYARYKVFPFTWNRHRRHLCLLLTVLIIVSLKQ